MLKTGCESYQKASVDCLASNPGNRQACEKAFAVLAECTLNTSSSSTHENLGGGVRLKTVCESFKKASFDCLANNPSNRNACEKAFAEYKDCRKLEHAEYLAENARRSGA